MTFKNRSTDVETFGRQQNDWLWITCVHTKFCSEMVSSACASKSPKLADSIVFAPHLRLPCYRFAGSKSKLMFITSIGNRRIIGVEFGAESHTVCHINHFRCFLICPLGIRIHRIHGWNFLGPSAMYPIWTVKNEEKRNAWRKKKPRARNGRNRPAEWNMQRKGKSWIVHYLFKLNINTASQRREREKNERKKKKPKR